MQNVKYIFPQWILLQYYCFVHNIISLFSHYFLYSHCIFMCRRTICYSRKDCVTRIYVIFCQRNGSKTGRKSECIDGAKWDMPPPLPLPPVAILPHSALRTDALYSVPRKSLVPTFNGLHFHVTRSMTLFFIWYNIEVRYRVEHSRPAGPQNASRILVLILVKSKEIPPPRRGNGSQWYENLETNLNRYLLFMESQRRARQEWTLRNEEPRARIT